MIITDTIAAVATATRVGILASLGPDILQITAGNYGGKQASISADASAGGNWLYGGSNNQIVLQATQMQDDRDAGYNLAYGIAEIGLTLKN